MCVFLLIMRNKNYYYYKKNNNNDNNKNDNNNSDNWTLLKTLKSYNLKDENKTINYIYKFKLGIRKYLHNFKRWKISSRWKTILRYVNTNTNN